MSIVIRLMDGPAAPLAIHTGPSVTVAPQEVAMLPSPTGRQWTRLSPEMDPASWPGVEWYELAVAEPTSIGGNDVFYYRHRGD